MKTQLKRRDLIRGGVAMTAIGGVTVVLPSVASAQITSPVNVQTARIFQLTADFHKSRSIQDIELMMALWADDPIFVTAAGTWTTKDQIRAFFLASGSWTSHRMAFAPTFKDQIEVHGNRAWLYLECHDVELATGLMVTHLVLSGTLRKDNDRWLLWHMTSGQAPLSVDKVYLP
ncbi:MAG: nuclear transport factor 2 family protein [Pedococcus sp.]